MDYDLTYSIEPEKGLILLFPGWLSHGVRTNTTDFDRISILPYASSSLKHSKFHNYINSFKNPENSFVNKINSEIENENIILLINKKNHIYKSDKIRSSTSYDVVKINESNILGKPNYLNIFLPKKCLR